MDQTSETEKQYQKQKYEEIIEILLSAGYFRARINTLSEFDKVVGGLCWCITSSGEEVDVDILFQENSTIGQRIALSEAIVKTLRKMHCPIQLQPHQIQGGVGGSDYPAIFPVIVWLVKKFMERRAEREAQLRSFSTLQFSKNFCLPTEAVYPLISKDFSHVLQRKSAMRIFKRRELKGESEETRVRSCLLEFGISFGSVKDDSSNEAGYQNISATKEKKEVLQGVEAGKKVFKITVTDISDVSLNKLTSVVSNGGTSYGDQLTSFEKKLAQAHLEAQKEEIEIAQQTSKMEEELLQQMSTIEEDEATGVVSGSNVGAIVNLGSSEIGSVVAAYKAEIEETKRALDTSSQGGKLGLAAALKRQLQNLISQKELADLRIATVQGSNDALQEKLTVLEQERDSLSTYNKKLKSQLEKLAELEKKSSQQEEITMLNSLVSLNEMYKAQETSFKASCKAQLEHFNSLVKEATDIDTADADEEKKLRGIEDMHVKVLTKYNHLRQLLAQTNLDIASNIRVIDDVPTRSELMQYERRFVELYQQVAWKLDETKKYYSMYNTLDTTLTFMQKEIKLLDSISSSFEEAMVHPQSKQEYLDQFELIVKGIVEALRQQEGVMHLRERKVEELKSTHQNLVDEQRKYFKAVKDFQDECTKNEWLTVKLEQAGK